jgi:hypothetical protein
LIVIGWFLGETFDATLASGVPLSEPAFNNPAQRSGAAKSKEEEQAGQREVVQARMTGRGGVNG